ncbi:MAG: hypothetical protein JWN19_545 [Arthrobacter sp.]|jgi:hypothetical protein|nr:hypothetical protein [Arthrobacter sp.]
MAMQATTTGTGGSCPPPRRCAPAARDRTELATAPVRSIRKGAGRWITVTLLLSRTWSLPGVPLTEPPVMAFRAGTPSYFAASVSF